MNRRHNNLTSPRRAHRIVIRVVFGVVLPMAFLAYWLSACAATKPECAEYTGRKMMHPPPLPSGQIYRFEQALFHPDDCTYEVEFEAVSVGERVQE